MKYLKTFGLIVLLLAATTVGGYGGWIKYHNYLFISDATPLVKNTTLRLLNCLAYETQDSDGITYKELFEKLEENISEAGKSLLAIQTMASESQKEKSTRIEAYLRGAQELQRALLSYNRKIVAVGAALERAQTLVEEMKSSNRYTAEIYTKMATKALEEAKAAQKEREDSTSAVVKVVEKMKGFASNIAGLFPKEAVIEPAALDAFLRVIQPEPASSEAGK